MTALRSLPESRQADYDDLRRFLCERYWLPVVDFPLCSDIFHALRITGDDCHEFMNDYSMLFGVDLTDYVWPKYHLAEAEAMDVRAAFRPLMRFAGLKTQPLNRDLVPISIEHLLHLIPRKRWVDPEPGAWSDTHTGLTRTITRFSSRLKAGGVPRTQRR